MERDFTRAVAAHYGRTDHLEIILRAVAGRGGDPEHPGVDDLATLDEFHVGARPATEALIEQLPVDAGARVLDIGCGIGGPARCLAARVGCEVVGVDLTPEHVTTAAALTRLVGLEDRVTFLVGDACALPLPDASFDGAWTIHALMNIPDKAGVFAEARRVLRPRGFLAIYDLVAGPAAGVPTYPMPWARTAATSRLEAPDTYTRLLGDAGFRITHHRLADEQARAGVAMMMRLLEGDDPVGRETVAILMGDDAATKVRNLSRAVEGGMIGLAEFVAVAD